MVELWKSLKDVVEFGESYEISNLGRIRSIDRISMNGKNLKGKLLKPRKDKDGYLMINLNFNAKKKTYKVHRLVALAFIDNPDNKPEVNHINGKEKCNNCVDNLEWTTSKENIKHAHDKGLMNCPKGMNHSNSKLTDEQILELRQIYATGNYIYKAIANMFGIAE